VLHSTKAAVELAKAQPANGDAHKFALDLIGAKRAAAYGRLARTDRECERVLNEWEHALKYHAESVKYVNKYDRGAVCSSRGAQDSHAQHHYTVDTKISPLESQMAFLRSDASAVAAKIKRYDVLEDALLGVQSPAHADTAESRGASRGLNEQYLMDKWGGMRQHKKTV
jgi:hypothetical protein